MTVSHEQFERARRLALSLAGIELVDRHRDLLARRSRRLGNLEGASVDGLTASAEDGEAAGIRQHDATARLRSDRGLDHLLAIAMTARATIEVGERRLAAGMNKTS